MSAVVGDRADGDAHEGGQPAGVGSPLLAWLPRISNLHGGGNSNPLAALS